ncbi:Fe-S protein assembly co-chaperone HscB [bacterium]|jgi:molecular chaperone HscB|nr:Fe-S protein assembly co-chaperone HscB [Bacteroidota bacterium]MDA7625686.1 Fe-S protein assembly co-chaperone HscB [bacterium]MDF1865306.1 Fe-S protein assembly co-chaperone HscB [Saprospiraceae bacterium]
MNYFKFYNIPLSFNIDKGALKRTFYANSKKYHPDFFTLDSEEKQAEILELSTLNNEAYKTLNDFDKRLKYILELKGVLEEEGKNKLPQSFLMEMMDLNEAMMELQFGYDEKEAEKVRQMVENHEVVIYSEVKDIIENYNDKVTPDSDLLKVKDYFLKKRYLLRIFENLNKFASA